MVSLRIFKPRAKQGIRPSRPPGQGDLPHSSLRKPDPASISGEGAGVGIRNGYGKMRPVAIRTGVAAGTVAAGVGLGVGLSRDLPAVVAGAFHGWKPDASGGNDGRDGKDGKPAPNDDGKLPSVLGVPGSVIGLLVVGVLAVYAFNKVS